MQVYSKCANYASDTCPCVLAENGHCIVCSLCRGEDFCTCTDTVSFCIMQELKNNGGKAKDTHHITRCEIVSVKNLDENLRFLRVKIPHGRAREFKVIGSYVFVRVKENTFYDVPISVFNEDLEKDTIDLIIQIRGVKTETFRNLKDGDFLFLRGPYCNGIQGRKTLANLKEKKVLAFCRGIGFIPSLRLIDFLCKKRNQVEVYVDEGKISWESIKDFLPLPQVKVDKIKLCDDQGNLNKEIISIIREAKEEKVNLIHLGLSSFLSKKFIDEIQSCEGGLQVSCINNSQVCCGEGICGSCTKNIDAEKTVHLCKEQLSLGDLQKVL